MDAESQYIEELRAEIERLKESAKYDAFLRKEYRQLITELCDALLTEETMSDEGDDLIQRAREAARFK